MLNGCTSKEMSQYQNSFLMCEDRKRVMERQNAEESLRMWRRKKAEEIATKEQDKIEVNILDLLLAVIFFMINNCILSNSMLLIL